MTSNTEMYSLPELQILQLGEFDMSPEFSPETTLLDRGIGKDTRFWRPYRVCYLDRASINPAVTSNKEREKVNLRSLCRRRMELVKVATQGLLEGRQNIPHFSTIERTLNWIDIEGRADELYTPARAKTLYRDYTDHLRHRLRLSRVGNSAKPIGYAMAQKEQQSIAYICSNTCGIERSVIRSWAIQIPQAKSRDNELPAPATTEEEHAIAYALHKRFFDAFSHAVLNQNPPPIIVHLSDLGFEDFIYYNQSSHNAGGWSPHGKGDRSDWKPYFFRREGVFDGMPSEFNRLLEENDIKPINTSGFSFLRDKNKYFSTKQLKTLANHATRHFGYLLMAETGSNAQHLASIDCKQLRLDKAIGLSRTRAIKGRSEFEDQDQFVDTRFAQTTWRQYLNLSEWMAQHVETPPQRGIFLIGDTRGGRKKGSHTLLSWVSMTQLTLWPKHAPSLATRPARKHRSVNLLEGSAGNYSVVTALQSVGPATLERHYVFKNRLEAAESMSRYFEAQAQSAQLRWNGVQLVRVIEGGYSIYAGHCDAENDKPKLIEGFEDLGIEPRCSAPVTCMFCVHFGIHTDTEELLAILTMNRWIEVQSRVNSTSIDEHFMKFAPFQSRIHQILEGVGELDIELRERLSDVRERFDKGEHDPYWNAKITALLEYEEA